jgi:pSer/pThr/pTyr-binding forkhead associated (FHA) protein
MKLGSVSKHPRLKLLPDGPYIEIDGGSLYLGRDCHLAHKIPALSSKVVSSRHLRIRSEGSAWQLEDLGSTNGTWVHGTRITRPVPLKDRDVFAMGRAGPQWQWEAPVTTGPRRLAGTAPAAKAGADAGATLLEGEGPLDMEKTFLLNQTLDGSGDRPFRVGRTPSVLLRHLRTEQKFAAEGYTIVIGRDPAAAQVLIRSDDQRHVSGRHAEIAFRSTSRYPVLRDLGSSNGTWLNDRPLKAEVELHPGDRIILGAAATTLQVTKIEA